MGQINKPKNSLSITPGITANLDFDNVVPTDFIITPTEGTFSAADVGKLSITSWSIIDGGWQNGDAYELYLDGNEIRMRGK